MRMSPARLGRQAIAMAGPVPMERPKEHHRILISFIMSYCLFIVYLYIITIYHNSFQVYVFHPFPCLRQVQVV